MKQISRFRSTPFTLACEFVLFAGAALGLAGCGEPGEELSEPIATTRSPLVRVKLGAGTVALGLYHACAVTEGGGVKCWGNNDYGQLGYGDTRYRGDNPGEMGDNLPFVNLGTGLRAQAVVALASSTCALIGTRVKCWGANSQGELGLGDTTIRGARPGEMGDALPFVDVGDDVIAISGNSLHVCVWTASNQAKCWGSNRYGELGKGDTSNRGDNPGEMGAALSPISFPSSRVVRMVATSNGRSCAIMISTALGTNQIKCWGDGAFGGLGYGDTMNRGDNPGEMSTSLPYVDLGTGRIPKIVSTGTSHTCALLDNGKYKCWGYNADGALGLGDTTNRGDGPNEMGDNLPYVNLGSTFVGLRLAANPFSTCAVSVSGKMKCWGDGTLGALGSGDMLSLGYRASQVGDNLPYVNLGDKVEYVAGGLYNFCAVLISGQIKCWGYNINGQLGLGDTANRGDNPGEMGTALPAVDLGTTDI